MTFLLFVSLGAGWLDGRLLHNANTESKKQPAAEKSQEKPGGSAPDDLIFGYPALDVFTGLLALATFILAVIAIRQIRDSRAVQRAYIFPLAPQHQFLQREGGEIWGLRLWVPWKNSGTTPASPVNSFIGATWVLNSDDFQFDDRALPGHQSFVLGPGAEIPSGTVDITLEPLNDLLIHRRGHQFLWGWARYQDIFQSNRWHIVEFCFRVTVDGRLGLPPFTGRVSFAFDGPHNRYYDERF